VNTIPMKPSQRLAALEAVTAANLASVLDVPDDEARELVATVLVNILGNLGTRGVIRKAFGSARLFDVSPATAEALCRLRAPA
jgi:hypothetical protein